MRQNLRRIIPMIFTVALVGCVSNPSAQFGSTTSKPVSGQAAQALPRYSVGDKFVFLKSAGSTTTERVVGVQGDTVSWRRGKSIHYTRHRNFILPDLKFESLTSKTTRKIASSLGVMWPLRTGESQWFAADYNALKKVTGKQSSGRTRYKCRVLPQVRLKVRAGVFDTIPISCERYSRTGWYYNKQITYYAPKLGHYVFIEMINKSKAKVPKWTRELQSYSRGRTTQAAKPRRMASRSTGPATRPAVRRQSYQQFTTSLPGDIKRKLEGLIQNVLQLQANNESTEMTSPNGVSVLRVKPTSVRQRPDEVWCRDFVATADIKKKVSTYSGLACKLNNKWRVQ